MEIPQLPSPSPQPSGPPPVAKPVLEMLTSGGTTSVPSAIPATPTLAAGSESLLTAAAALAGLAAATTKEDFRASSAEIMVLFVRNLEGDNRSLKAQVADLTA